MRRALLDINVLLALLDAEHVDHRNAHQWLARNIGFAWASCAITENGFVRVISQPAYPHPVPVMRAIDAFEAARRNGDHEFWPGDVSISDGEMVDRSRLHGPKQVTDAYLLALAVAHDGRLVTFDRSLPLSAVPSATAAHLELL